MSQEMVKMKELNLEKRITSFDEVVLGYSEEEALEEAKRCLQCKKPSCISGCPVGVDIKKFIYEITQKDYTSAYNTIKEKNNFPSICGRVCPAEYQCRRACVLTKRGSPVASEKAIAIGFLERFIGDYGMKYNIKYKAENTDISLYKNHKVAIIGSGPAGLSCAGELARRGVQCTIFESLHQLGGVLRYGIPTFRLPREVLDYEINYLRSLNVEFRTNFIIGRTKTIKDLFSNGFEAVFIGTGAGAPTWLNIEGENLGNIYSANEFLTRVNLMHAYRFPQYHTPVNIGKHVVVIGGGNTAMDAARVALRLQRIKGISGKVSILYRRTEAEMPARKIEIDHAKEEGVEMHFLVQPVKFLSNGNGYVRGIQCLRCKLGEPDASNRPKPIPIEGSEFELPCDLAIIAIGLKPNQTIVSATEGLNTDKEGNIIVNPETMETSIENVFAGGDIVGGEGTVIEAMGMGKKAAHYILKKITENSPFG
jgi:glutamate synthase (NADPH/NADH) small chain